MYWTVGIDKGFLTLYYLRNSVARFLTCSDCFRTRNCLSMQRTASVKPQIELVVYNIRSTATYLYSHDSASLWGQGHGSLRNKGHLPLNALAECMYLRISYGFQLVSEREAAPLVRVWGRMLRYSAWSSPRNSALPCCYCPFHDERMTCHFLQKSSQEGHLHVST